MNKLSKSLLVATSVFASCSAHAVSTYFTTDPVTGYVTAAPDIKQQAKDRVNTGNIDIPKVLIDAVNVSALQNVVNDGKLINLKTIKTNLISVARPNTLGIPTGTVLSSQQVRQLESTGRGYVVETYYNPSSLAGSLNGHNIQLYTKGGTSLGNLGKLKLVDAATGGKVTKNTENIRLQGLTSDTVVVNIDGKRVFDSTQTLSREDALGLFRTLDILPGLNTASSTTLGPMSPSGLTSQIMFDKLNPRVRSHKEQNASTSTEGVSFSLADLKFQQVQFANNGTNGSIQGLLMAISTEVAGVEIGAYIPYDYLSFNSFDAHRTGGMLYAKKDWQLPMSLQLSAMANFNGIATYVTKFSVTGTVGGGFGTSLAYDDGGDFVPRVSFAFQYNKDYYPVVGKYIKDDEQYLVKMGGSLGYRLFENGTINAGFTYTRDITGYSSIFNKNKDNDYFDISIGGSYSISDLWQVNLTYKRILGLETYYANEVFLGTSIGF